jgi:hypothetical protein
VVHDVENADSYLDQAPGVLVVPGSRLRELRNLERTCAAWPAPKVILLGATEDERQSLCQFGLLAPEVLSLPIDFDELARALEFMLLCILPFEAALRCAVGHRGLKDIRSLATWVLLREALHQSHFNRHQVARLLGVSRSAVQQMMAQRAGLGRARHG